MKKVRLESGEKQSNRVGMLVNVTPEERRQFQLLCHLNGCSVQFLLHLFIKTCLNLDPEISTQQHSRNYGFPILMLKFLGDIIPQMRLVRQKETEKKIKELIAFINEETSNGL